MLINSLLAVKMVSLMADESNKTNNTKMVAIWSAFDGWNGLVPGVSQLSDAIAKFGNYHRELKFTNGITYEFAQGAVQVVLINDKATIYKIRVLSTFLNKELMPTNIDELLTEEIDHAFDSEAVTISHG